MRNPIKRPVSRTCRCERCKNRIRRNHVLYDIKIKRKIWGQLCRRCYDDLNPDWIIEEWVPLFHLGFRGRLGAQWENLRNPHNMPE